MLNKKKNFFYYFFLKKKVNINYKKIKTFNDKFII